MYLSRLPYFFSPIEAISHKLETKVFFHFFPPRKTSRNLPKIWYLVRTPKAGPYPEITDEHPRSEIFLCIRPNFWDFQKNNNLRPKKSREQNFQFFRTKISSTRAISQKLRKNTRVWFIHYSFIIHGCSRISLNVGLPLHPIHSFIPFINSIH